MTATWAAVSCTLICCQLWYMLDDNSADTVLAARGVPAYVQAFACSLLPHSGSYTVICPYRLPSYSADSSKLLL